MKALLFVLFLAGCSATTAESFVGADGNPNWYHVSCHEDYACWGKAGEQCGTRGYYTVRQEQEGNWTEMIVECR